MRIAVIGAHRVGKTTLAEALADALPGHRLVPEPYHLLEEEGYEMGEMPSIEDFERMLERSIEVLQEGGADVVFDRCPLDMLVYLLQHEDHERFDRRAHSRSLVASLATLDLIVRVPIEAPDRIAVPRREASLREDVDATLARLLEGDLLGPGVEVMTVRGSVAARLDQVLRRMPM